MLFSERIRPIPCTVRPAEDGRIPGRKIILNPGRGVRVRHGVSKAFMTQIGQLSRNPTIRFGSGICPVCPLEESVITPDLAKVFLLCKKGIF